MELTKEEYFLLKEQQEKASRDNDYSKLIMMGSPEANAMKKYEQDNLCKHPNVRTSGGIDYCDTCGKQWR